MTFTSVRGNDGLPRVPESLNVIRGRVSRIHGSVELLSGLMCGTGVRGSVAFGGRSLPVMRTVRLTARCQTGTHGFGRCNATTERRFLCAISRGISVIGVTLFSPRRCQLGNLRTRHRTGHLSGLVGGGGCLVRLRFSDRGCF